MGAPQHLVSPVWGGLPPAPGTAWGICGHGWRRAVNHAGTGAQGGLCAGAAASQGSRGRGMLRHFSEVPFRSGKESRNGCWVSDSERPFIPLLHPFSQLRSCHIFNHLHYFAAFLWMDLFILFFLNSAF